MDIRYKLPFADHLTLARSGRQGTFGGAYKPLHGTRWDSCSTYDDNHAFAFGSVHSMPFGAVYPGSPAGTYQWVADPLANGRWLYLLKRYALHGWQLWPASLVQKVAAAHKWADGSTTGVGFIDADYTRPQLGYRALYRTQLDGTTCQGSQCNATAHAMAADADHRGINPDKTSAPWRPTPHFIYTKIRTTCGGTSMLQNDHVLTTYYGS